jgi:hypothetical protein
MRSEHDMHRSKPSMNKNTPGGLQVDNAMGHHRETHTYMAVALSMVGDMVTVMVTMTMMAMEGDNAEAEALEVEGLPCLC